MASAYCSILKNSFPRPKRSIVSCGSCSSNCFSASMRSSLILLCSFLATWHPVCGVTLYARLTPGTSHSRRRLTGWRLAGTFKDRESRGKASASGMREGSRPMPSYRFCRPDDLTLIIRAINACYLMHYPDEPAMTAERLKEQMTLFDVRPGNCMVALERQQPVGVVVSTRRDSGVWIQALGCQPAFQRRGIATQLVEALLRKIAIQRAPLVTVDVPTTNTPALRFFEAVQFTVRGRYVSYQGLLTEMTGIPGNVEVVPAPDL